ncbi:MAG: Gldg family protein [Cyclobacteriaceae bacterium]|nr:Gldg family protein [Cyclobacteriaceae bacterium]
MKKRNVFSQLLIIIAILFVVNLISNQLFFRLDFTADKQYTLSDATRNILHELDDVITITAYYSEDLPPQLVKSRKDFVDLLVEYENRSDGSVVYEFINPSRNEEAEMEAQQAGISPIMVNVRERDQVKQMRAYMGAVLQMGEKKEVIPVMQPGTGMEYSLTTSIKKLAVEDKPKIAFLQGHGEPPLNASVQLLEQLNVLYDPEPYTITDTAGIPVFYKTIAIIDPKDTIPESHFRKLDQYLAQGGGIYLAFSNLQGNLNQAYLAAGPDIGLKSWLLEKGVTVNDLYVIDANCGSVTVRQQQGPFMMNSQIQFPYFPIISNFSDHPAGQGLESVFFPFISSISYSPPDSAVNISPVAFTSENSGVVSPPAYVDINKDWTENDFRESEQVVVVALEGPLSGSGHAKMVIIPNGQFAVNGEGQQQQSVNEDNINLASNAIDWISDDTGLINLRTKGITNRPLEQLEEAEKSLYKYGNVIIPILFVLVLGFIRKQRYNAKKQRWIQGNI